MGTEHWRVATTVSTASLRESLLALQAALKDYQGIRVTKLVGVVREVIVVTIVRVVRPVRVVNVVKVVRWSELSG